MRLKKILKGFSREGDILKNKLLIIVGPTAVGKTDTSIELAKHLNGEIISADSMQIYKYMNIGTAKPTISEMQGIPHHLINVVEPNEVFTAADFQKQAEKTIAKVISRNKLPIIAGGTGLYINSIIYDMDFTSTVSNWPLRKKLQEDAAKYGNDYIHNELKKIDVGAASRIHKNNVKRVIRAIEIFHESGEKIKDFQKDLKLNNKYDFTLIGLTRDRQELYDRINQRVDIMIKDGLINEVSNLLNNGYDENLISFKGLGYKEIISYIKYDISLDETIEVLKRDTRRYAKRQLTWFKRLEDIQWYNLSQYDSKENLISHIIKYIKGHFEDL